jgi:hypothetical protein
VWDPDEIIVQFEPKAKMLFLLALLLPLGLILLEYVASRPYEISTRHETQRDSMFCRVGIDMPGIEVCSSSQNELHIVEVQTNSLSDILVVKYIFNEDAEYRRNLSEYHNVTNLSFKSYWRFRVQVKLSMDGYVYFAVTTIEKETVNRIKEWHSSYCFLFLCVGIIITELKSLSIIYDVKYN